MRRISYIIFVFPLVLGACSHELPERGEIDVPFSSQAPEADWSEPWQSACEETSIMMVDNFFSEDGEIDREKAKREILKVFEKKREELSFSKDESSGKIATLINGADLGWSAEVVEDPSLEDMKLELSEGRPIIIPIWAPDINNPHYIGGGPDYHVMVVTGYDDEKQAFIVNDPGTAYGNKMEFSYETIMNALIDFDDEAQRVVDAKRVIFTKADFFKFLSNLVEGEAP